MGKQLEVKRNHRQIGRVFVTRREYFPNDGYTLCPPTGTSEDLYAIVEADGQQFMIERVGETLIRRKILRREKNSTTLDFTGE
jgi:hypothetical protein